MSASRGAPSRAAAWRADFGAWPRPTRSRHAARPLPGGHVESRLWRLAPPNTLASCSAPLPGGRVESRLWRLAPPSTFASRGRACSATTSRDPSSAHSGEGIACASRQRAHGSGIRVRARSALREPKAGRALPRAARAHAKDKMEKARESRGARSLELLWEKSRRRPTLPHGYPCSTIGSEELNFRVRDGIGCGLFEITTGNCGIRRDRACASRAGGPESVPRAQLAPGADPARKPNPARDRHGLPSGRRLRLRRFVSHPCRSTRDERLATLEGILDVCLRDMAKPHDLLVPVSSVPCSTSTPGLSTSWSTRGL